MTRLATQAKNRLHAVLQRHHLAPPEGSPFLPERRDWWLSLPVSALERQLDRLRPGHPGLRLGRRWPPSTRPSTDQAASGRPDGRWLLQLPGISLMNALTILAAIGEIIRFPDAKHLVGYAGLGARVHDSGQTTRRGRITKAGRRELAGRRWWKPLRPPLTRTPTGRLNWPGWSRAWDATKPSWPSPASCWSPSGTC